MFQIMIHIGEEDEKCCSHFFSIRISGNYQYFEWLKICCDSIANMKFVHRAQTNQMQHIVFTGQWNTQNGLTLDWETDGWWTIGNVCIHLVLLFRRIIAQFVWFARHFPASFQFRFVRLLFAPHCTHFAVSISQCVFPFLFFFFLNISIKRKKDETLLWKWVSKMSNWVFFSAMNKEQQMIRRNRMIWDPKLGD